jgi:hypothetical protein
MIVPSGGLSRRTSGMGQKLPYLVGPHCVGLAPDSGQTPKVREPPLCAISRQRPPSNAPGRIKPSLAAATWARIVRRDERILMQMPDYPLRDNCIAHADIRRTVQEWKDLSSGRVAGVRNRSHPRIDRVRVMK